MIEENEIEFRKINYHLSKFINEENLLEGIKINFLKSTKMTYTRNVPMFNSGEFSPATKSDPSHIKKILNLYLTQEYPLIYNQIEIVDCKFDLACNLQKPKKNQIVIFQKIISKKEKLTYTESNKVLSIFLD